MFLRFGYAGAMMRTIAATAEVSVQTVEVIFKTKRESLKTVVDVALSGDDEPSGVERYDRIPDGFDDRQWCRRVRHHGLPRSG